MYAVAFDLVVADTEKHHSLVSTASSAYRAVCT